MTPKSFDTETCSELVGDSRMRTLEAKGRILADSGEPFPTRAPASGSYWSQVQDEADYRVMLAAYGRRLERKARMAEVAK